MRDAKNGQLKRDRLLRDNFDLHLPIEPLFLSLLNTVGPLLLPVFLIRNSFHLTIECAYIYTYVYINDRFVIVGEGKKKRRRKM